MIIFQGNHYFSPRAQENGILMALSARLGGISTAPFDTLNFSTTVGDTPTNVARNFEIFSRSVGIRSESIVTCNQVHGADVLVADSEKPPISNCDAIISINPDWRPAVMTADCLPILIVDPKTRVCAAIHAGWKGTVLRIAGKVTHTLQEKFGVNPDNLVVALGPCINVCCYEVDEAVLEPFRRSYSKAERFIKRQEVKGRTSTRLDLPGANYSDLMEAGVKKGNIVHGNLCTCCSPQKLFSHRRSGPASGRHLSVVGFMPENSR